MLTDEQRHRVLDEYEASLPADYRHTFVEVQMKDGSTRRFSGSLKWADTACHEVNKNALARIFITEGRESPKQSLDACIAQASASMADMIGKPLADGDTVIQNSTFNGVTYQVEIVCGPQVNVSNAFQFAFNIGRDSALDGRGQCLPSDLLRQGFTEGEALSYARGYAEGLKA